MDNLKELFNKYDIEDLEYGCSTGNKWFGSGEIINIGNGKNKSINEIASYVGGKIKYIEPVLEPFETLADNLKAKKLLNWEPKQDVKSWIKDYIKKNYE